VNLVEPVFTDPELPILDIVMGAQLFQAVSTHQELDRLLELYSYVHCVGFETGVFSF
jgi:hypothetical protein